MANMVTSIVMQLVDRVTRPVRRIQQSLSGMAHKAGLDRLGRSARQVGVQMGFVIGQAKVLGARLLALGALGGAAAWGVTRLVKSYTEPTDAAVKLSRRLSMTYEQLQLLTGAAGRMTTLGAPEMASNLEQFERRMGDAVAGVGEAADAYKWAGIKLRDSNGQVKSSVDVLMEVADKMANIKHAGMQQRFANALFGRSGADMINMLRDGRKGIETEMDAWSRTGQLISQEDAEDAERFNDNLGELTGTVSGLRNRLAAGLVPAMNKWLEGISSLIQANRELIGGRIREGLTQIWSAFKMAGSVVSWVADRVGGFGNLLVGVAGIMAGKFVLSVGMAAWSLGVFAKDAIVYAITALARFGRGLVAAGARLVVFAARGVAVAATSLVSLSRGLIGLAARAVPAAIMGIRAMSLALLTTPVGWIITGITAVAGIAYLLYKNWDGVAAWFGKLWEGVKAFFSQSPAEIAKQLVAFSPAGLVYRHWEGITTWFGKMWEGVKTFFVQGVGEVAKQLLGFNPAVLLGQGVDAVFGMFETKSLAETGTKWISGLWDGIKARWSQLTSWLRASVADLTSWMPDWAKDRLGIGSMAAPVAGGSPQAALGAPVATPGMVPGMAAQRSQVDVGGQLKIQIDSEGRARVKEARSRGGMGFDVDAGVLGMAQ
nr:phage tail tape measure protein [Alcaligenes faecalis]